MSLSKKNCYLHPTSVQIKVHIPNAVDNQMTAVAESVGSFRGVH